MSKPARSLGRAGASFWVANSIRFWMKRRRMSSALAGIAVSVAVCAALWPHARDAGAVVLAQDDPAALADAQIGPVLQKNKALIPEQIEAALAANDADLASSFVALAREKNIP